MYLPCSSTFTSLFPAVKYVPFSGKPSMPALSVGISVASSSAKAGIAGNIPAVIASTRAALIILFLTFMSASFFLIFFALLRYALFGYFLVHIINSSLFPLKFYILLFYEFRFVVLNRIAQAAKFKRKVFSSFAIRRRNVLLSMASALASSTVLSVSI